MSGLGFPGRSWADYDLLIGRLLQRKGIVTGEQVDAGLVIQRREMDRGRPTPLGRILVAQGYASEPEVVEAINDHYGLSVESLSENIAEQIRDKQIPFTDMLPRPRIPIWVQLFVAITAVVALAIIGLSVVTLGQQREQLYQQTVKLGTVSLNYFANNARIPILDDNVLSLNSLIREATAVAGIRYALIVDHSGRIMAHTDYDLMGEQFAGFDGDGEVRRRGEVRYFNITDPSGERILNLQRPITFQSKPLGEVHVGVSIDFIEALIRRRAISILAVSAAVILVGIVIALFLGFRFSRPVTQLVAATEEISKGNYQHKVILDRNDELGNLSIAFNRMSRELWRKSMTERSFGKYVGTEVLEMIMANPESVWLKGHRGEATVIFTDIRGFTAYSESQEPETVVEKLNAYFEIATDTILRHGGYVDKFIGDAVLGVFGVPVFREDHVERAVRAAFEIQSRLAETGVASDNPLLPAVGIGLNTGVVVSGNIGSQTKMEYTVIGDSVNVASRINGLAGPGEIIAGRGVYERMGNAVSAVPLPPQQLKGKADPISVFRLTALVETPSSSR